MSLPTDPTTQLARLVELNTEIAEAHHTVDTHNRAAMLAGLAAGAAQEDLNALEANRDELLEAMKVYTTEQPAGSV